MWREIPGTDGLYEASEQGDIRSLDRVIVKRNRWGHDAPLRKPGRVLKPWRDCNGYSVVYVCVRGGRKAVNVHRLVAAAFHGSRSGADVNHIDGDKTNNAASNLEWCSRSENIRHAQSMGRVPLAREVIGIPKQGGDPVRFSSSRAAAIAMGGEKKAGNIKSAICGMIPSAYGFYWQYA